MVGNGLDEIRIMQYGSRVKGEWEKQLIRLEHIADESYVVLLPNGDKHTFVAGDHKIAGDVVKSEFMK